MLSMLQGLAQPAGAKAELRQQQREALSLPKMQRTCAASAHSLVGARTSAIAALRPQLLCSVNLPSSITQSQQELRQVLQLLLSLQQSALRMRRHAQMKPMQLQVSRPLRSRPRYRMGRRRAHDRGSLAPVSSSGKQQQQQLPWNCLSTQKPPKV